MDQLHWVWHGRGLRHRRWHDRVRPVHDRAHRLPRHTGVGRFDQTRGCGQQFLERLRNELCQLVRRRHRRLDRRRHRTRVLQWQQQHLRLYEPPAAEHGRQPGAFRQGARYRFDRLQRRPIRVALQQGPDRQPQPEPAELPRQLRLRGPQTEPHGPRRLRTLGGEYRRRRVCLRDRYVDVRPRGHRRDWADVECGALPQG